MLLYLSRWTTLFRAVSLRKSCKYNFSEVTFFFIVTQKPPLFLVVSREILLFLTLAFTSGACHCISAVLNANLLLSC